MGNIGIARGYLGDYCLLVSDDKVVFDCYCLPSFRWKAFYAQVYVQNGIFRANCAYTRYADFWGLESYSVSFVSIEEKRHTGIKNDIICKSIFLDNDIVDKLLMYAGTQESCSRDSVVIDGITAGIRLFENGIITRDVCLIDPDEDTPLLDELLLFSDRI